MRRGALASGTSFMRTQIFTLLRLSASTEPAEHRNARDVRAQLTTWRAPDRAKRQEASRCGVLQWADTDAAACDGTTERQNDYSVMGGWGRSLALPHSRVLHHWLAPSLPFVEDAN